MDRLENIPVEAKRHLDLLHSLDKRQGEATQELYDLQFRYLDMCREKARKCPANLTGKEKEAFLEDKDQLAVVEAKRKQVVDLSDEKCVVAEQFKASHKLFLNSLDKDVKSLYGELLAQGVVEESTSIANGTPVAARTSNPDTATIAASGDAHDWILCSVVEFSPPDTYKLVDADPSATEPKHYEVNGPNVRALPSEEDLLTALERFPVINVPVFAIYPDTTAFYKASLVVVPFPFGPSSLPHVTVQFADDEDAQGILPKRNIPVTKVFTL